MKLKRIVPTDFFHLRGLVLVLLSTLMVAACDSDSDSNGSAANARDLVVTASLGRISGGTAQAVDMNGDALSDPVETDDAGRATLDIPADFDGPLMLVIRGGPDAVYFDEALGTDAPFGDDQRLRAALPGVRDEAGVSTLTELATRLVEAGDSLDAAAVEAANESVRSALAPEITDLLTPPAVVDEGTGPGDLGDDDSGRLAARLGALAELAEGTAAPALTILEQLAADVADGTIDGTGADGAIDGLAYDPASFEDAYLAALRDYATAFGNDDLQASAMDDASVRGDGGLAGSDSGGSDSGTDGDAGSESGDSDTDGEGSGSDDSDGGSESGDSDSDGDGSGSGSDDGDSSDNGVSGFVTEPATVDPAFVDTFTLVYFDESDGLTNDPFSDEQEVEVTIGSDGTLTIDDVGPLSDPFLRSGPDGGAVNPAEIIWEDPATGLLYALSNNETGSFNEINVGDPANPQASGFPGFLGQIREPEPETNEVTTLLESFATDSSEFRVTDSCTGSASCPDETAAGDAIPIVVSGTRIMIGSLEFDPAGPDASFSDQRTGTIEPSLKFTFPGPTETAVYSVSLFPAQFEASGPPVAGVRLRLLDDEGPDPQLEMEFPEALRDGPAQDYFRAFVDATASPVELVYVQDDADYSGKGNTITSAPFGTSHLCRSFEVRGVIDPEISSNLKPQFGWFSGDDPIALYDVITSRSNETEAGDGDILGFRGGQFVLFDTGSIRLDEGFADNTSFLVEDPADQATSVQADIDAACADFVSLGGMLTLDEAGSITLRIEDTADPASPDDDEIIYERTFVFEGAGSLPWDERLPVDLAYRLSATKNVNATLQTCTEFPNGDTGTLTTPVSDADVDCSAAAP